MLRKHAGEHLEAEVFLVAQTVGTTLEDANLVVQSLDETERDFVLGAAVRGESAPVTLDHVGEAFVGRETLPLELRAPVVEELPCPGLARVIPQLAEGLF